MVAGWQPMTWKPDRRQIDLIADHCAANMPLGATAAVLGVELEAFRAWIGKLAATRFRGVPEPSAPMPPASPTLKGHRPDRVLADRLFERPELAEEHDREQHDYSREDDSAFPQS